VPRRAIETYKASQIASLDLKRSLGRAFDLVRADNRLPAFFAEEPLASTGTVFDVSEEALDGVWR